MTRTKISKQNYRLILYALSAIIPFVLGIVIAAGQDKSGRKDILTPQERQWLSEHDGSIRIGITEIPPQVLPGESAGTYVGLSIDYIKLMERQLGCTFKLVYYKTWNEVMQKARNKDIDMIFAAQKTPERSEYLLFSKPYIELPNMIIVRNNMKGPFTLDKMKGLKIVCSEGSAVHEFLKQKYGYLDIYPVKDEMSGLTKVSFGEADAMVVEISRASYNIEKAKITNLRVAGSAGYKYELCIASRKDWPVLNHILDKGLSSINDADREAITRKWIVVGSERVFAGRRFWISFAAGLSVVVLTLLGVMSWNWTLKRQVRQRTIQLQQQLLERRRVEAALAESRNYLDKIINSAADPIFVKDREHRWVLLNDAFCSLMGRRRDEVLGKSDYDFFPKDEADVFWAKDEAVFMSGLENINEEKFTDAKGVVHSIVTKKTLYTDEKKEQYIVGIISDMTERKKLEAQLAQSQRMETVGLLAGGIAHDFNNLLTPILGYAELLILRFPEGDQRRAQLQQIKQAGERAKDLTRRLLAFSRKQMIELKTVDLGDIIRKFESILRRTIRENIIIEVRISPSLSKVRADAGQIEQALVNLSINAQDAMPEGGTLMIEAGDIDLDEAYTAKHPEILPGPYVMLSVSDTGVGIDEKVIGHIFEPFYTTKELGRGTGLGLSTVYGIVKQHSGSISVYSEKDRGSIFKVFLPRVSGEEERIEERPSQPDKVAHGVETVLVVEDNEVVRTLACKMLENLGYQVLSVENPDLCIELVKKYQGTIDLLLTDVVMPGMNGKDLYDLLHRMRPDLKVIFMSGYTSNVIGHHGVLDKGMHFIQKPFSIHALSEGVRHVLDS